MGSILYRIVTGRLTSAVFSEYIIIFCQIGIKYTSNLMFQLYGNTHHRLWDVRQRTKDQVMKQKNKGLIECWLLTQTVWNNKCVNPSQDTKRKYI